jgi:ketosteroid isomerase-like protein
VVLSSDDPAETRRDRVRASDRSDLAHTSYTAYETGDRTVVEELLADDFVFFSPADVGIDRATYFERCWPNHEHIASFEFERLVEAGDEVFVTYEARKTDGKRFRNTEILTFRGDKLTKAEVYFGWNIE